MLRIISLGNYFRFMKKRSFNLKGPLNKFYMRIEALLLPRSTSVPSSAAQRSIRDAEQRIEKMRLIRCFACRIGIYLRDQGL